MRPAFASRLARLVPAMLAVGLVLAACVTTAAPGWTFELPPTASPTAAASGSTAASSSVAPSASSSTPASPSASASGSPSASASGSTAPSTTPSASASPSGASAGVQVKIGATNTAFDTAAIEAKAGQAFQIVFTNNDSGVPHNVQIKAADGSEPFKGSLLTGPGSATYDVPALAAGAYTFSCVVHPSMTGTLTVK